MIKGISKSEKPSKKFHYLQIRNKVPKKNNSLTKLNAKSF